MRQAVTFQEVSINAWKKGHCRKCGKIATRQKRFYQTINPFNLTKDGFIKTREEIYTELNIERKAWGEQPVYHAKCE